MRKAKSQREDHRIPKPRILLPIGDPDRDKATVVIARTTWESTTCKIYQWEQILDDIKSEKTWERYPPEKPYGSLDALLKAEIGLNTDQSMSELQTRTVLSAKQVAPALSHGGDRKTNQTNQVDNYKVEKVKGGTSAEYLTSKIARDRPDILERMKAGEFRSVRQAAIEAGIVKPKATKSKLNYREIVELINDNLTEDEKQALSEEISPTNNLFGHEFKHFDVDYLQDRLISVDLLLDEIEPSPYGYKWVKEYVTEGIQHAYDLALAIAIRETAQDEVD